MEIRSTDPTRSRSIDDLDDHQPAAKAVDRHIDGAAPDWDRVPTLDTAAVDAIEGASDDPHPLRTKLENLQKDLTELHDALAPYARECKELHHGVHEIEEALHLLKEAKHVGLFAPAVVLLAVAKAEHGLECISHGWEGMHREAPEAARKAEPALKKVVDDIAELRAALTPSIERPVTVRG